MAYKRTSPMPIIEGGTNAITMANTYGVNYFDGTRIVTTAVGTAGQVLTSNGAGVAPTFQAAAGNGKSMIGYGTNSTSLAVIAGTLYLAPFYTNASLTQSEIQFVAPVAGTLSNLYVNISANASTTNVSFTLNINSVNTALTLTVTALTTGVFSDLVNSVAVAQGDLIQFEAQQATTGAVGGSISMQFEG